MDKEKLEYLIEDILQAGLIASRHIDDHPFKVALGVKQPEDIVVALLHDSLEDKYADLDELNEIFTRDVVRDVIFLTKQPDETYFDYIRHIKKTGGRVLRVKRVDAKINYFRSKYDGNSLIKRYEKALQILGE